MTDDERYYWISVWRKAVDNMPLGPRGGGQKKTLHTLLGYKPEKHRTGGANNHIYTNLCRGSKPRDPVKVEKLLKLAGPYGKLIAWMTLCKMGLGRRYKNPLGENK